MIIWRGWGIIVVPIVLIIGILGANEHSNNITAIRLAISAIIVWKLGNLLNNKKGRLLVDQETNEVVELRSKNDLFWIDMQYWAIPIFISAFVFLFID